MSLLLAYIPYSRCCCWYVVCFAVVLVISITGYTSASGLMSVLLAYNYIRTTVFVVVVGLKHKFIRDKL